MYKCIIFLTLQILFFFNHSWSKLKLWKYYLLGYILAIFIFHGISLNLGLFLERLCLTPQILHVSSSNTHPPQGSPTAYIFLYQDLEYQQHDLFISYTVKQTVIGLCPLLYDFQPPYQGATHIWCQNCHLHAIADCQLA